MKVNKCKWCNGTGKEQPKRKEYSELDIFGYKSGGFIMNKRCNKCHGTGVRSDNKSVGR